jgi:hypothetical protein
MGFDSIKIARNSYQGTYNFEIYGFKSASNLSIDNLEKIARSFLSKYMVNDTPSEKRMLETWMDIYRKQVEASWATKSV